MTAGPVVSKTERVALPAGAEDRLDSWKEIAGYLKRGARTVQRWEREQNLPVRRLHHEKLGSVYAYRSELDAWWQSRGVRLDAAMPQEAPDEPAPSVAVLAFSDLSPGHDFGYFCEGIAEEIAGNLAGIPAIRVAPAASRETAREMGVTAILEGSVRESANRLRIAVRLVDAGSGFQLWSERYDRECGEAFAVQENVANHVVRALQTTLMGPESRVRDFCRRARDYFYRATPQAIDCALQMFLRAVEIGPECAAAYAGMADCWSHLYLYCGRSEALREQADWAATRAVEMNPASAEAQAARGLAHSLFDRNGDATASFEEALRLDPGLFEAHYSYARHCLVLGQWEKAASLYEGAIRVRADHYQAPLLAAQVYDALGRGEDAALCRRRGIDLAEKHLKWSPDDVRAMYLSAHALAHLGDYRRARQAAERALAAGASDGLALYNIGRVYFLSGDTEKARDLLEQAARLGVRENGSEV